MLPLLVAIIINVGLYILLQFIKAITTPTNTTVFAVAFSIIGIVSIIIFVCSISSEIQKQLKRLTEYESLATKKEAYKAQLADYVDTLKEAVLQTYPQLEKDLMDKIKDSKLLAAHLEKGDYGATIKTYCEQIAKLQGWIHGCDTEKAELKAKILAAKRDTSNWGLFVPSLMEESDGK